MSARSLKLDERRAIVDGLRRLAGEARSAKYNALREGKGKKLAIDAVQKHVDELAKREADLDKLANEIAGCEVEIRKLVS